MTRPLPTWRNKRVGEAALARRLDRFLIKTSLYRDYPSTGNGSAQEKTLKDDNTLAKVDSSLSILLYDWNGGFISAESKTRLIELENQRAKIPKEREESWPLKSIALWLKARDKNTSFFQNYAEGRKVSNTIWNMPTQDGGTTNIFSHLSKLGISHFQHLYK
eukprot:PITA_34375